MKVPPHIVLLFLFPVCALGSTIAETCSTVVSIKANPQACIDRPIRLEAYLVSTRHGSYFTDSEASERVLTIRFSEAAEHRKAISQLLDKITRQNIGHPYGQIRGVFEGRVLTDGSGAIFEVYGEAR